MVVKKGRKSRKQRGTRTCGWGLQHRGGGQRGGRGKGGIKAKQPARGLWKLQVLGKHGFKKKGQKTIDVPINIRELEQKADNLIADKKAKQEADTITINLNDIGYNKLLSTGKAKHKWKITVSKAAKNAVEKIKKAGGEVIVKQ